MHALSNNPDSLVGNDLFAIGGTHLHALGFGHDLAGNNENVAVLQRRIGIFGRQGGQVISRRRGRISLA